MKTVVKKSQGKLEEFGDRFKNANVHRKFKNLKPDERRVAQF